MLWENILDISFWQSEICHPDHLTNFGIGGPVENSESSNPRSGAWQSHAARHQSPAQRDDAHC